MSERPHPEFGYSIETDDPKVISNHARGAVGRFAKFIVLETYANLMEPASGGGTPTRTGFLRASWICSVGVPSTRVGGKKLGKDAALIDTNPAESGLREVKRYEYTLNLEPLFIVNNAIYSRRTAYDGPHAGYVDSCFERALNIADAAFAGGIE